MAKSKNVSKSGPGGKNLSSATQIGLMVVLAVAGIIITSQLTRSGHQVTTNTSANEYNPKIKPSDFTTNITNKYFRLPVGRVMTYELETEEGLERIQIEMLAKRKKLMGVDTITYWDRVWLDTNGDKKFSKKELIEETYDYLAQDKKGNVWYFGEEVDNYVDGKLVDHDGSWLAGEDGALPGIWIKGKHKVGDSYLQEYYEGEAEDTRDVVATDVEVKIKMGEYDDCVQFYDWTPLDPESREYKYYCPEVGALVMSQHLDEDKNVVDTTELVKLSQSNRDDDDDND